MVTGDPEVAALVEAEERRQAEHLVLIPSENYASAAVRAASGSVLSDKYSEGYAGRRCYEGNAVIDQIESLAVERARALFGVDYANVQPYSGSPANLAVYLAFCDPGATVLGMALAAGGHLTHGHSVSATGRWFRAIHYQVRRDTGRVDVDPRRSTAPASSPTATRSRCSIRASHWNHRACASARRPHHARHGQTEMRTIARWIDEGIAADEAALQRIRGEVLELTAAFPVSR